MPRYFPRFLRGGSIARCFSSSAVTTSPYCNLAARCGVVLIAASAGRPRACLRASSRGFRSIHTVSHARRRRSGSSGGHSYREGTSVGFVSGVKPVETGFWRLAGLMFVRTLAERMAKTNRETRLSFQSLFLNMSQQKTKLYRIHIPGGSKGSKVIEAKSSQGGEGQANRRVLPCPYIQRRTPTSAWQTA